MEYDCIKIPLKQVISECGVVEPLCDNCVASDCSHPIEYCVVSVLGINRKHRLHMGGGDVAVVVNCKGHIDEQTNQSEIDGENNCELEQDK